MTDYDLVIGKLDNDPDVLREGRRNNDMVDLCIAWYDKDPNHIDDYANNFIRRHAAPVDQFELGQMFERIKKYLVRWSITGDIYQYLTHGKAWYGIY